MGKVTHYFDQAQVAVVSLTKGAKLKKGERVRFLGHGAEYEQDVSSLQVDHKDVEEVKSGDDFGLKVDQPVKEGTEIFRV